MSGLLQGAVWATNLPTASKAVLASLADRVFDEATGDCTMSIASVMARTSMSRSGTQAQLKKLKDAGWIRVVPQFTDNRQNVNRYQLNSARLLDSAVSTLKSEGMGSGEKRGGSGETPSGVQEVHPERIGPTLLNTSEEKTDKKKPKKKNSEPWPGPPIRLVWAEGLHCFSLVDGDHPSGEWLDDVQGSHSAIHMKFEVAQFVDYYNAPKTRKLKEWKTAFRTWINRSVEDSDSSEIMHDTSLPRGECKCQMCLKRAGK